MAEPFDDERGELGRAPGQETAAGTTPSRLRKLHARALRQAEHLLDWAREPEAELARRAERVSRWSVGEHLAHMVLVDRASIERLEKALAGEPRPGAGVSLAGRVVLWTGVIPRGMGRAPDIAVPGAFSAPALRRDLEALQEELRALGPRLPEIAAAGGRSRHPVFGDLTAVQWLRFVGIHHRHHLKIIRDIRRVRG